jgi:hypothetical protein
MSERSNSHEAGSHQAGLALRRQELVERSGAQRAALVASAAPLVRKAEAADRVLGYVQRHPVLAGAATAVTVLLGSRRLLEIAARAARLYFLLRR